VLVFKNMYVWIFYGTKSSYINKLGV